MDHAIVFDTAGGPDVLRLVPVEVGAPGSGEVRIRHRAIGINFIDTYQRSGLYPVALPSGLGQEAAGVVEAVGAGVTHVAPGDRVAYAGGTPGAYSTARLLPASVLVKLPETIGDDAAASMMLQGMTVEYLVRRTFRVEPGMTVLWHAIAGGVGQIALQWLKAMDVTIIGTVGSEDKAALARGMGCHHVINYRDEDVVARVREITGGKGVPVVYDSVGKDTFRVSLDCLARRGTFVSFGNASGPVPDIAPLQLAGKGSLYVTRPRLADYIATREELEESSGELFSRVADGTLSIRPSHRFALADAAKAHRALENRETTGSVILEP
ncbi:quinone oxidoreductase family protein [Paludibacterium paludis]|uniref:Quinone oxidoreductase n=1 Tax=Paludibacterium paludis TaxID=1225769 RepID=A0A918P1P5_9NEIS|nr:quinone oxidoreductase [Paludibacterium paludis]GGY12651.1 quinone oxidoreductase [Paludibacterium paludis]